MSGASKPNQKVGPLNGPFGPITLSKSDFRDFQGWTHPPKSTSSEQHCWKQQQLVINRVRIHSSLVYADCFDCFFVNKGSWKIEQIENNTSLLIAFNIRSHSFYCFYHNISITFYIIYNIFLKYTCLYSNYSSYPVFVLTYWRFCINNITLLTWLSVFISVGSILFLKQPASNNSPTKLSSVQRNNQIFRMLK